MTSTKFTTRTLSSNPRINQQIQREQPKILRRGISESSEEAFVAKNQDISEYLKLKFHLNDLELKTTLGTGTFGRVVLARHKRSSDYFALKMMPITEVIRLKQIEHVTSEKSILQMVKHPFIVEMLWAQHDDTFLYMLLEYICGGELFSYLRNAGRFSNGTANFYAAELVSALDYLHTANVVYRDLKPENLLLDREGHVKLTDFGFAKKLEDRTYTLCGTPEYLAPEIIQSKGYNKAIDWWALGILIYEMLVGYAPFYDDNPFGIYEKILSGQIDWPRQINKIAKDLIKKLLVQDRTRRLGNMKNGSEDVKRHKWFRHIDWTNVINRKLTPPIRPVVTHRGDTRNFYEYPESQQMLAIANSDGSGFQEYPEYHWQEAIPAPEKLVAIFKDF